MQLGWQKLVFILTVLPCCWSLHVSIPQKEYKVAKGKDTTLTCSFQPATPVVNNLILTWDAYPDVKGNPLKTVASYFLNSPVDISPAYEDRVSLEVNVASGTSTLHFTKATMQDNRTFQCSVKIPGDSEGTTAASTFLLVLEPPSPPICKLQGKAEYFHNISITCLSEEGSPRPVYQWTSYSVENIPRQFPPKTTEKDGIVSLFNISRETSGFFICKSENEIGSASCNFTLAVMASSMNMGSTGIIIGGVLAGIVVAGVIIFCCCRRKGKKDKYTEGSLGGMEFHDKDGGEAGRQYMDDKSNSEKNQADSYEDKDVVPQSNYSTGGAQQTFDDDQHNFISGKERYEGKGSDVGSQHYPDDQHGSYRGSRDHLDDQRKHSGSRDRLDDQRDRYGSRDRLDDNRDRNGSRDRLDDNRDRNGSRDRLDDNRDRYGSRDRLEDNRDRYGSRDRLEDNRDRYGSRDRLDDNRDHYGSRDRLDDNRDRYGSRDRLDDNRDNYGRRDRFDNQRDHYGSRDRLDDRRDR
ncbi:cell surface A33 antigen-like isoform X2 [Melanotaenia boesemani]|nr:cell surface A33 antigen-like isoform X2 [Melanotaenia boesemani]